MTVSSEDACGLGARILLSSVSPETAQGPREAALMIPEAARTKEGGLVNRHPAFFPFCGVLSTAFQAPYGI